MSEQEKEDIKVTVDMLKGLDKQSLLLIYTGALMLKARQDMEEQKETVPA